MKKKRVVEITKGPGFKRAGKGKRLALRDAVERHIRPGMKLHLAGGIGGPSAAICEIMRQYWGRTPKFALVQSTVTGHSLNLIHAGLVRKLICAVCADISASARPSRVIQTAHEQRRIELENWSLNSLQQRLMAAAFGVPFMPTRSILKSGMASDNKEFFREIENPFEPGARAGVVSALQPDISIVHGCLADSSGNTILAAPAGEDLWGALASRNGAIVTVEKIVPTEFIRRYAALVKIPAYAIRAVVEAPMGLHPFSLANPGIRGLEPYEMDIGFLNELHDASSIDSTLDEWIVQWVIDCGNHRDYLEKIGEDRIAFLKKKPGGKKKARGGASVPSDLKAAERSEPREMMLIALAREICNSVNGHGHRLILAGAGVASTAAFLAYYQLEPGPGEIDLVTGNGQIGYAPIPGESILASEAGVRSSKMLTDTVMTQGVIVGGMHNKCLAILGAGQIDKYGNINSTKTAGGKFLVGSGGANDALNAREIILCLDQSKKRFVEKLAFITGSGDRVTTVVSTMGIFRKSNPLEEFYLAEYFPSRKPLKHEEIIQEIRSNCGWDLKIGPSVRESTEPSPQELRMVRWLLQPQ